MIGVTMRNTIESFAKGMATFPMSDFAYDTTRLIVRDVMGLDAGFFSIDADYFDAIKYAADSPAQLPPLPYPKVIVDIDSERTLSLSNNDLHADFHGFYIQEVIRGSKWQVVALLAVSAEPVSKGQIADSSMNYITYCVTEDAESIAIVEEGGGTTDLAASQLRSWVVECIHLITAKNVVHVPESRQMRRNTARKLGVKKVNSFTIRMSRSQGTGEGYGGSRTYTVRWIVRGHYRDYKSGKRSWIDPYIKGPAGAPWRNPHKPVYIKEAIET